MAWRISFRKTDEFTVSSIRRLRLPDESAVRSQTFKIFLYEWSLDGGFGKFFYLNFYPEARIGIPPDHRKTMPNEFIIVGFLLYTLYFTDYNIELNSLEQFKRLVRVEYPDFKAGLNLTLAKTKQMKATQRNDEKIDQCIQSAFAEFNRIGWIELEGDRFEILPAFQRLALIYSDQINDIDNLLKQALEK